MGNFIVGERWTDYLVLIDFSYWLISYLLSEIVCHTWSELLILKRFFTFHTSEAFQSFIMLSWFLNVTNNFFFFHKHDFWSFIKLFVFFYYHDFFIQLFLLFIQWSLLFKLIFTWILLLLGVFSEKYHASDIRVLLGFNLLEASIKKFLFDILDLAWV